ncbi:hypothetical protein KJ830_06635 [bacterium]|nr:hypothetical protein [bacterium]MBU4510708.1 hypothetical protein [bacterium]
MTPPVVVTPLLHLGEHKNDKVNRYYSRDFQMRLLSECDRIIVQTSIERDYLINSGIDQRKISLIGQGINLEYIQGGDRDRFRRRYAVKEKSIVFHVATKSYDKGTIHLIEAMKKIWEHDRDIRLILAGAPMDDFSKYFQNQPSLLAIPEYGPKTIMVASLPTRTSSAFTKL